MSCCTKTYNLGCFNHCGSISFGEAESTETLTAILSFANNHQSLSIDISDGDPYLIPLSSLNEDAFYTFKLYDDSGSVHTVTIDDIEYDCFEFKTMVVSGITVSTSTSDTCCASKIIHVTEETYVLTKSQWSRYGAIPNLQAVVDVGGGYQNVDFQQQYNSMPTPTEITITVGGSTDWYLIVS
jgi:hypothetical protein